MSFDFLDRRSAERFAELLDQTSGAGRHQTRGPAEEELAELVAIGHRLSAARAGVGDRVDPEFRVGLRAMLVATADRDGIGAASAETEPGGGHAAIREPGRSRFGRATSRTGFGRRIRARGAIVIGVAAGAMAVSGISAASEGAVPGDPLYGVKLSTERAQLAMAGSNDNRGELSLVFARTRLTEAAALSSSGAFAGVLDDMDADTRQGVRLLTESAVAHREERPLDLVDGFVAGQKKSFAPMLSTLSPDNRERADQSLALLADVQQRADDLRRGLACETVDQIRTDDLGPELRGCTATGSDSTESDEPATGQGSKADDKRDAIEKAGDTAVGPEGTDPTTDPGTTGRATAPGDTGPATGEQMAGVPTPDVSVPAQPSSEEDDGMLGDLLGGIFG